MGLPFKNVICLRHNFTEPVNQKTDKNKCTKFKCDVTSFKAKVFLIQINFDLVHKKVSKFEGFFIKKTSLKILFRTMISLKNY